MLKQSPARISLATAAMLAFFVVLTSPGRADFACHCANPGRIAERRQAGRNLGHTSHCP